MEVTLGQCGGRGNVPCGAVSGGDGKQNGVVRSDFAKLLAQEKGGFVKQRGKLIQKMAADVLGDGGRLVETKEVLRQTADEKIRPGAILQRPAWMEPGSFLVTERLAGVSVPCGARTDGLD